MTPRCARTSGSVEKSARRRFGGKQQRIKRWMCCGACRREAGDSSASSRLLRMTGADPLATSDDSTLAAVPLELIIDGRALVGRRTGIGVHTAEIARRLDVVPLIATQAEVEDKSGI